MRRDWTPPRSPRQNTDDLTIADVVDFFAAYRTDPEAVWAIAALVGTDPSLRLGIAAIGGATVGRRYANNDWIYGLWRGDRLHRCGIDLRCGAMGKTHHQMAVLLCEYLADDESLDEHTRERLAAWIDQQYTAPDLP
jgi:hypothetical protein